MDAFSYLSVLLSIILGLAITQILTAAGRLIRGRAAVRLYAPPLFWAATLLVSAVQMWWTLFGLRERQEWDFLAFFVVLMQTVCFYMVTALVFPENVEAEGTDLRAHYEHQAPWFFGFLMATVAISMVKEVVLEGRLPEPLNLAFHVLLLSTCGLAIVLRRPWYHQALAATSMLTMSVYIAVLFSRLH